MKISELIAELEKLKEEHGDILVECNNGAGDVNFVDVVFAAPDRLNVMRAYLDS